MSNNSPEISSEKSSSVEPSSSKPNSPETNSPKTNSPEPSKQTSKSDTLKQSLKKFITSNYFTILLGIIATVLALYALKPDLFSSLKTHNTKGTQIAQNMQDTQTQNQDNQAQNTQTPTTKPSNTNPTPTKKPGNNAGNAGLGPWGKTPNIKFPTQTPTPTQSSGSNSLGLDMDLIHSIGSPNPNANNATQALNMTVTKYVAYEGIGQDIDKSFPKNTVIFAGVHILNNGQVISDIYIVPVNQIPNYNQLSKNVLYKISYQLKDDQPISDQAYIYHSVDQLQAFPQQVPYHNIVIGIYKGHASSTISTDYIGYADLKGTWNNDTYHFLVPLLLVKNINLEVGKPYTFLVKSLTTDSNNSHISIAEGPIELIK